MIKSVDIINIVESLVGIDTKGLIDELLLLYPTKDFKSAVLELSSKYQISPIDVVELFMSVTGALPTELPDSYTLKNFKSLSNKPSGAVEPKSKRSFGF